MSGPVAGATARATARAFLYAAALATGGAFSVLFTGQVFGEFAARGVFAVEGGAFLTILGAALVAVLVGSAGRYRFVLLFPATALYTLLAVYGWPPLLSPSGWRALFFEIGTDVYEAAGIMYADPVPYDAHPGILVLLLPVVAIIVTLATSATLYEESPVVSVAILGLTMGVLSTISFEDGVGPFFAVFLICAVALLLSTGAAAQVRGAGRPGVVAGAAVVALALALPQVPLVAEGTIRPPLIDWTLIGTGGTSRLGVQADVGDYLTAGRDAELMRVQSDEPLLWRGGTLDYFDGVRWSDTTEPGEGYGEEVAPGVETRYVRQDVEILNAQTDVVFGGYLIAGRPLPYAEEGPDGSWSVSSPLAEGTEYELLSEVPQPTTGQLLSAGTSYPAPVRAKYLQLPSNTPGVVAETAREIRGNYAPATPYDAARAVERYLVYDGGFVYNLDADFRRADQAIEDFLGEGREGFCTQFATSMALLLREMGVPSRVVYGATSGEEVEPGEYLVTGRNMHTWVEAYFPGVGWYPFDPTPGFSMPTTMEANAPRPEVPTSQGGVIPDVNSNLRQRALAEGQASEAPDAPAKAGSSPGTTERTAPSWPVYLLVPLVLLAAGPLAKRVLLSRGRPEDLYRDLAGRLRDVLPPGRATLADSPALTPTERLTLLAGAAGVEDGAFREFARAYSDHLYSAEPGPAASAVAEAHRRALRSLARLPRWRRLLGAANPASLLTRARIRLASSGARLVKALRGASRGRGRKVWREPR